MRSRKLLFLVLCWFPSLFSVLTGAAAGQTAGGPSPEAEEAARLAAEKRAAARPTIAILPYYSVGAGRETLVYLLNLTTYPLAVDVTAVAPEGGSLPLGRHAVDASGHLALPLSEELRGGGAEFRDGSLVLSFLGDTDTLQAWVVVKRGVQYTEIASVEPEGLVASELFSFWDDVSGRDRATYYLFNPSAAAIDYDAVAGSGSEILASFRGSIPAGRRISLRPAIAGRPIARGWMSLRHTGAPADLVATGFLEGPSTLVRLPMLSSATAITDHEYDAVRLTQSGPGQSSSREPRDRDVVLTVLGAGAEAARVSIQLLGLTTGNTLASFNAVVGPKEVRSFRLRDALGVAALDGPDEKRIRVSADQPIAVSGYSQVVGQATAELSFFGQSEAHAGGTYPIPSLAEAEAFTTVVNLDAEPATIVGQVFWSTGTYALGPLTIPAHGAYRFDFRELARSGPLDLLGRRLDPSYSHAAFKWSARSGARRLIGRTEVRVPHSTSDVYGFNCFGCCYEMPWGTIEPSYAEFFPGQSWPFDACTYVDTCNGRMGPYSASISSMSVPSPFSWNGTTIGASAAGYEDLSWEGIEMELRVNCEERVRVVRGIGKGDTCKHALRKNSNPAQSWDAATPCYHQTSSCGPCHECCLKIKTYWLCKKKKFELVEQEYQLCRTNCDIEICA